MQFVFLGAANPETGRVILAMQRSQPNFSVLGFIDNDPTKKHTQFVGFPVLGGFEVLGDLKKEDIRFVNLITGSTQARYETSRYLFGLGFEFANLIHPSVDLTMTSLGVGNYIQEAVILQAEVQVGHNSSIHIGTLVGHETRIGNSVFIAHGCSVSGLVEIGDGTFVGTHATVLPRLKIGKWTTIGAGAVVTKDVPDYAVVVGNPAKLLRSVDRIYASANPFERENE